ncbi:hypothetical protein [Corynebacterium vitaeruminis]|uniref:hypothetical protein n=1 Tax=Corynebacterium vitaeruminis TaxID=38305 RepID=UPI0023F0425A|nr:hypothetical protein [Corynebacterium vitaeruminis]
MSISRLEPLPGTASLFVLVDARVPQEVTEIPWHRRRKALAVISIGLCAAFGTRPVSTLPPKVFHPMAVGAIAERLRKPALRGPIRIDSTHFRAGADGLMVLGTVACGGRHFAYSAQVAFDPRNDAARVMTLRVA